MTKRFPFLASLGLFCLVPCTHAASWRPFADDSPWNTPIDGHAATDPESERMIDGLAARGPWYVNIESWSISVYFVDSDKTPKHPVLDSRPGIYGKGFEFPRAIPIPDDAVASPPVGEDSDNHLSIIDRNKGLEWGMWAARKNTAGEWTTGLGAVTDLTSSGVAVPWYENARDLDSHRGRASGFPLVAGLILRDEVQEGEIRHALAFAYDRCRTELFIPPASTSQVTAFPGLSHSEGIPMGGRIQLDPTWDVEHSDLSPAGKKIARALQKYGAYCSDYAGANVLYAENSPEAVTAWKGVLASRDLEKVFNPEFIRRHFRVIGMGNVLPGQNLTLPPPYALDVRKGTDEQTSEIDQVKRTIRVPASSRADQKLHWTCYPKGTQATLLGREPDGHERWQLKAPDGSLSVWTVIFAPAKHTAIADRSVKDAW